MTDGSRGTVYYDYDTQSGLLNWTQGLGDNSYNKVQYAYNGMQQLTGVSKNLDHIYNYTYGDSTWGDLLTQYDGRTVTSDAMGNMTGGDCWRFSIRCISWTVCCKTWEKSSFGTWHKYCKNCI